MAKKMENLKEMKTGELRSKVLELQENIRTMRFKAEGSKSKNVKELSAIKKQIARLLTEIRSQTSKITRSQTSKK